MVGGWHCNYRVKLQVQISYQRFEIGLGPGPKLDNRGRKPTQKKDVPQRKKVMSCIYIKKKRLTGQTATEIEVPNTTRSQNKEEYKDQPSLSIRDRVNRRLP